MFVKKYSHPHRSITTLRGILGIVLSISTQSTLVLAASNPDLLSPTASLASGIYSPILTIKLNAPGAQVIRYTINPAVPISCSKGTVYYSPLRFALNHVLTTVACYGGGYSPAVKYLYAFKLTAPSFSVSSGSYPSPQKITISATAANSIRYTVNGTSPTCTSGTVYSSPLNLLSSATIRAIACYQEKNSAVATATYTLTGSTSSSTTTSDLCKYGLDFTSNGEKQTTTAVKCWDKTALNLNQLNRNIEVLQNVAPPQSENDQKYRFHPTTIAYTQMVDTLISTPGSVVDNVKKFAYVWANRCHPTAHTDPDCVDKNIKGNPIMTYPNHKMYQVFFTSRIKADTCTIAQASGHAGVSRATILSRLSAVGLHLSDSEIDLENQAQLLESTAAKINFLGGVDSFNAFIENPLNAQRPWIYDTCYVPETSLTDTPQVSSHIKGIVLDYEPGDGRLPKETMQFFKDYIAAVRDTNPDLKNILFNNDLRGGGSLLSGIDSTSGPTILSIFDLVGIWVWPGTKCEYRAKPVSQNLDEQIYELNGNNPTQDKNKKIYVIYSLRNDEALGGEARNYVLSRGLGGVMVFRDNTVQDTCNIETVTTARHLKDLFNLPNPSQ